MEVLLFVVTVILAMLDTSSYPAVFFYLTLVTVVLINGNYFIVFSWIRQSLKCLYFQGFNGIFQNSVYGVAARLPAKYIGAVVLGSNISGVFTAIVSALAVKFAPGPKTSAIYYFLTALLILLACFDTYFALPLNVRKIIVLEHHIVHHLTAISISRDFIDIMSLWPPRPTQEVLRRTGRLTSKYFAKPPRSFWIFLWCSL